MSKSTTGNRRMSFWGVGPSISIVATLWIATTGAATYRWPDWFTFPGVPYPALLVVGLIFAALGITFQAIAGRALMRAYNQDRLVTSGVYAVCRNPLYANIILTLLPSIALVCDSWLMLTSSFVTYALTRIRIRREEVYLEQRFGQAYRDYHKRTNAIFPTIGRR